jgi:hypothetical protein
VVNATLASTITTDVGTNAALFMHDGKHYMVIRRSFHQKASISILKYVNLYS